MPFDTVNLLWLYALRRSEIQTKVYRAKYSLKDILLKKDEILPTLKIGNPNIRNYLCYDLVT